MTKQYNHIFELFLREGIAYVLLEILYLIAIFAINFLKNPKFVDLH